MCVTSRSCESAAASSGAIGPPASTRNASPPGPAATRYVFDSHCGFFDCSTIMGLMELIHTCYRIGDIDRSVAFYEAQGIEPEKPPYRVREGGSRICFVRDPDGYRIELIERPGA